MCYYCDDLSLTWSNVTAGEMESDQEDNKSRSKSVASEKGDAKDLNISHEDLSDVSDLDSAPEDNDKDNKVCEMIT